MTARLALRSGEPLAIDPSAFQRDAAGFFLLMGPPPPDNERHGTVAVVHVRGALAHWKTNEGDSYEAIGERVQAAINAEPRPSAVVLRVDSLGGVVSGLNETVARLRSMFAAAHVRSIAFVDETAASAGYALCCSCDEIVSPPTAHLGSVGVISTMVSQTRKDKADGLDFAIITSGARKADGHVHVPLSDGAQAAERERNEKLAAGFFALAADARGISPRKIESLQANLYLGPDAVKVGLSDDVASWDEVCRALDDTPAKPVTSAPSHGNVTDRRAAPLDAPAGCVAHSTAHAGTTPGDDPMPVRLEALIKTTETAIASEKDPARLTALRAELAAFTATRVRMEGAPPGKDDDDDDDDDEDDEKKAKKLAAAEENEKKAKRAQEAAKHRAKAAEMRRKAEESEEEAKRCEEDEEEKAGKSEEEAAATLALVRSLTGLDGPAARGALQAMAGTVATVAKDVASLKRQQETQAKDSALAALKPVTTKAEREWLGAQTLESINGFAKMRLAAGFVNVSDDSLVKPRHVDPGSEDALPAETRTLIEQACAAFPGDKAAFRKVLVQDHIKAHTEQINRAANGAGRY